MNRSVTIAGVAASVRQPGDGGNLEDLIFATARTALAASGVERGDVDGIVIAASDQTDGRAISSMLTAGPAGAYLTDEINIASSPGHAFALASMAILSGRHRRVLVSSWGNASESASIGGGEAAERLAFDPYTDRHAMSSLAARAMQALLQRARPLGDDGARAVTAKSRRNGAADPHGVALHAVPAADRASTEYTAYPLRTTEVAPPCDGAFSLLLRPSDEAADDAVHILGLGWRSDTARLSDRDLVVLPHLRAAAADAYGRAGLAAGDADLFELHDYSADAELLACEAVGACGDGDAPQLAVAGEFDRSGSRVVSPSGGSLAGEAPFGGPLGKVVAAVRQLRGDAGAVQVADAGTAVVQIAAGAAGQFQTVIVLGREART